MTIKTWISPHQLIELRDTTFANNSAVEMLSVELASDWFGDMCIDDLPGLVGRVYTQSAEFRYCVLSVQHALALVQSKGPPQICETIDIRLARVNAEDEWTGVYWTTQDMLSDYPVAR